MQFFTEQLGELLTRQKSLHYFYISLGTISTKAYPHG